MKTITLLHKSHETYESIMLSAFFPKIIQEFKDNDKQMMGLLRSKHVILPLKNSFEDI
jgi:hypothetical protein